ncbi:MAG: beta-phosphoglucomutase family hydrolase [Promethearchaeota archaeon]
MQTLSFDAVIFDLDGVITQTANLHSFAWKLMFDDFLLERKNGNNKNFREFTHKNDYLPYVDGKPRYEGVNSFLKSRNISIPYGNPSDLPEEKTICGLGNKKNDILRKLIKEKGVNVYSSTINLIKELKHHKIKIGVASSSKNCKIILDSAGINNLFETRIDGEISAELGLKGKPEPDIFITACNNLNTSCHRCVVIEDAVSGVQAGVKGNFGLVIGIARAGNDQELLKNGADIVVNDLSEISVKTIDIWFKEGLLNDQWVLKYNNFSKEQESARESLCTVGNGYFGTRGSFEESEFNEISYPGTYIAGIYNRVESIIFDRKIQNEDFVNCPNWTFITFKIGNDKWIQLNSDSILEISRELNLKKGILFRTIKLKDKKGRITLIKSERFASMDNPHVACLRYSVIPINYSEKIIFKLGLIGDIINAGVKRYRSLTSKHLEPISKGAIDNSIYLITQTNQSKIKIVEFASLKIYKNDFKQNIKFLNSHTPNSIFSKFSINADLGESICIEKIVSIFSSKKEKASYLLQKGRNLIENNNKFNHLKDSHIKAWEDIWKKIDIQILGNRHVQKLIRLNLYHLMITASPHNKDLDVGIPARGLHGEAYRGHIFWDELFILPFYDLYFPDIAKSLLMYRYRRLNSAKQYSMEYGYKGAMFPWQSASTGQEETQQLHLNPISGKWGKDYSPLQRHVSIAICYNIWQYYWITEDIEFLEKYGAELFLEICLFWGSISEYNPKTNRYEIHKVIGPDEFHEKYPNSKSGGLKDNSYTNIMVTWVINTAFKIFKLLSPEIKDKIVKKINLSDNELMKWKDMQNKMNIIISKEGIISQFDGYFDLEELDWEFYQNRYKNIMRMDRILKSEGKSPNAFKVSKQADTLMIFYLLDIKEIADIFEQLSYNYSKDILKKNFDYYYKRTSHGSTLSSVVHSYLAELLKYEDLSYKLFLNSLESDYSDIQNGTTGEGIHTGVMGGTILLCLFSYVGLNLRFDNIQINPRLPKTWHKLKFSFCFKKDIYYFKITSTAIKIKIKNYSQKNIKISIANKEISINPEEKEWVECILE